MIREATTGPGPQAPLPAQTGACREAQRVLQARHRIAMHTRLLRRLDLVPGAALAPVKARLWPVW